MREDSGLYRSDRPPHENGPPTSSSEPRRRIAMTLKRRLHPNMPLGFNIISTPENPANIGRDFGDLPDAAGFGNLFFHPSAVQTAFLHHSFENRIHLETVVALQSK